MIAFVRDKFYYRANQCSSLRLTDWPHQLATPGSQRYGTGSGSSSSSSSSRKHALPIGSLTALRVKCGINFRFIIIDLPRRLHAANYVKFTAARRLLPTICGSALVGCSVTRRRKLVDTTVAATVSISHRQMDIMRLKDTHIKGIN